MKEKLLVSACLLGEAVRYDGKSFDYPCIVALKERYDLYPFCPEVSGGLPIPRVPAERKGDKVLTLLGGDVTKEYVQGAEKALALCVQEGIQKALLKAKSPSCGKELIYDGTYTKTLTKGHGVACALLLKAGIDVFTEEEGEKLL